MPTTPDLGDSSTAFRAASDSAAPLKIGMVCPYSFDVPGGVQFHIRDFAERLRAEGHDVQVLAPADEDTELPEFIQSSGRAVPLAYNGSVARVNFGPVAAARVRRWLLAGDFDVVHIHEPVTPSISLLALWAAVDVPIVATFHTSMTRSRAMQVAYPLVRPSLERISARIAVSEDARRTVVEHIGGDAVVIPNGVRVDYFAQTEPDPNWVGTPQSPTLAFLGRLTEPRKGLAVLLDAMPQILQQHPDARVAVIGPGNPEELLQGVSAPVRKALVFLGSVSEAQKASILAAVDLYIAPQLGGESFGIVLVEAMSCGTAVLASDLSAFRRVLDEGNAGTLFAIGDSNALAVQAMGLLADAGHRREMARRGAQRAQLYDWSEVTESVLNVYATVRAGWDLYEVSDVGENI